MLSLPGILLGSGDSLAVCVFWAQICHFLFTGVYFLEGRYIVVYRVILLD